MADLSPGSFAIVMTDTTPLALRSAPRISTPNRGAGSNVITELPRGTMVRVTGPIVGSFYPVADVKFGNGFASSTYLIAAPPSVAPEPDPEPEPAPAPRVDPVLIDLLETLPVEPDLGQPAPDLSDADAKKKKMMIIGGAVLVAGVIAVAASSMNKPKASGKRARA